MSSRGSNDGAGVSILVSLGEALAGYVEKVWKRLFLFLIDWKLLYSKIRM